MRVTTIIFLILCFAPFFLLHAQELFTAPAATTHSRWISGENLTGQKGAGGMTNKGAKGNAFITLISGSSVTLMDVKGSGIVHRIWISGTIPRSNEQRRMIRIEMYWDGEVKPAVSVPIGDFFGVGLGLSASFENEFFSSPEGKSFNATIPMPFRKAAKIVLVNESSAHALVWFDINYTAMSFLPEQAMYFHAYWNRVTATELGKDYVLLPKVQGIGRYLGTNIGVIGDPVYNGTWFGEGEVKIFLDGDDRYPSLVGTGTEDYIGTGWGQGQYSNRYQGSLVSDNKNDIYAFYRYHISDPVYFHDDCKVTIQQIGNTSVERIREMVNKKVKLIPTWVFKSGGSSDIFNLKGEEPTQVGLLENSKSIFSPDFSSGTFSASFYRSDDVSSTVYFYLDKPASNLQPNDRPVLLIEGMESKVWSKRK